MAAEERIGIMAENEDDNNDDGVVGTGLLKAGYLGVRLLAIALVLVITLLWMKNC